MNGVMVCEKRGLFPFLFLPLFFVMAVFLFAQNEALAAAPAYRASGAFTSGAAAITPPYPAGMLANDICLLAVESENQAITLTTANGFVEVPTWSPQSAGTAITDPASRLALFWKRTVGGDTAPQVADSGNHTTGQIHCFSGVTTSGNPWDTGAGGNDGAVNDTTGTIPGSTTTVIDTLVVLITSTSRNANSTTECSAWTNADLASLTERADNTSTSGLGGGHCMATGVKATVGAYAATTVTLANTSFKGAISLALKPGVAAVVSVNCPVSCAATSAATVSWTVIFDQSVTGVDATAFTLVTSGLSGAYITTVTGSGTTWTVTANTGIGAGTLGLNQTGPGLVVPTLSGTFTGQVYTISTTPALAEYRMDESAWTAAAGQVVDSSGNGNHAQAFNSANTVNVTPAISGSPGTCGYGVFDNGTTITQGYVQTPLPNLTTDFTVTAWIRTTNNTVGAQRILIDDQGIAPATGYGFSLGEAGAGKLRFFSRGITPVILDSTYVIANNTWYFVAAVADVTNKKRTIYVFNAAGTFLNSITEAAWTAGAWGTDGGPVSIGAEVNGPPQTELPATNHFKGNLDEVRVYQKVLSQSALAAIATQSHSCSSVDHVTINAPATAMAFTATPVVISPHTVAHVAMTGAGTINLSTSTGLGDWSIGSGTGTLTPGVANSGLATYIFGAGENSVTLYFSYQTAGAVTINVTDTLAANMLLNTPAGEKANTITYTLPDYMFTNSACVHNIAFGAAGQTCAVLNWSPQVAGVDVANVYITALSAGIPTRFHPTQARIRNMQFALSCHNPVANAGMQAIFSGVTLPLCQVNGAAPATWSATTLTASFPGGIPSAGPYVFNYVDVGKVELWMRDSAVITSIGAGGIFVVAPHHFGFSGITAGPIKAGNNFGATVTAYNGLAIPTATFNFGKETVPESATVTFTKCQPTGINAINGTFSGSVGSFNNGAASAANLNWGEVGNGDLTATLDSGSYLGSGLTATGNTGTGGTVCNVAGNVGVFIPDHFITTVTDGCAGCGFTYSGQPFSVTVTAMNGLGTPATTFNYDGTANTSPNFANNVLLTDANAAAVGKFGLSATPMGVTVNAAGDTLTVPNADFSSGVATLTSAQTYTFNASQTIPTTIKIRAVDAVNASVTSSGFTEGTTGIRSGRVKVGNAYGSELIPLTMTATLQYYDGSNWVKSQGKRIKIFRQTKRYSGSYHPKRPLNVFS